MNNNLKNSKSFYLLEKIKFKFQKDEDNSNFTDNLQISLLNFNFYYLKNH